MSVTVETTRFGALQLEQSAIITFTQPIIGFQDYRRFTLIDGPENSGVTWLQSLDSPELAFLMLRPKLIIADYKVSLHPLELSELAVGSVDELETFSLLVVPEDQRKVRTNLKAPILINQKRGLGKQTVLENSDYPIQFFLAEARAQQQQEAIHARTDT